MKKWSDILKRLESQVGKRVDFDGYYGSQCVDLIMDYIHYLSGKTTYGNAIDYKHNYLPEGFKRFHHDLKPQKGDILVYDFNNKYGHVAIVGDVNGSKLTTYEANVDGNPDFLTIGGPVRKKTNRTLYQCVAIIRPEIEFDVDDSKKDEYELTPEKWHFTVTTNVLNVRNEPSTIGNDPVDTYTRGEKINYDGYIITNGYVWISYISNSGTRRYVAARKWENGTIVENYGHFR